MRRHVAFLRAVNVGGRIVKMERLRRIFEAEGFAGVRTVGASGNVIFEARSRAPVALEGRIERALGAGLGFEVATFVRAGDELLTVVSRNPFARAAAKTPGAIIYVTFLKTPLAASSAEAVRALGGATDELEVIGREVYWLRRVRSMETLRLMARLERATAVPWTMRNVTSVERIVRLLDA